MPNLLAIDIGGTRIKYALIKNQNVLGVKNVESAAGNGGPALVQQIQTLVAEVRDQSAITGVAISTAGQVDSRTGIVTYAGDTIPNYINTDWVEALKKVDSKLVVSVENDVNCALLAELRPADHYTAMITVGTGIGGAMAIDDQILHGANNSMGEIGYLPLGGETYEQRASTSALVVATQRLYPNRPISGYTVFELESESEKVADLLKEYFDELARGLQLILLVFPANRLIIGGGIAENPTFVPRLTERLRPLLPPWLNKVEIDRASYGNTAGLIGAARHWQQEYQPSV